MGLASSRSSSRKIILYQGTTDTVAMGNDVLEVIEGDIKRASLLAGSPKISMTELESVMTISEKLKSSRYPFSELHFSLESGRVVGIEGKALTTIPRADKASQRLVGLPASSGKVTAICTSDIKSDVKGKILVLKNSKELPLLMKHRPAGIILEEGSLLSHAAILAREAGIPAIVKVHDALMIIKSGEEITLDADAGVIRIPTPH